MGSVTCTCPLDCGCRNGRRASCGCHEHRAGTVHEHGVDADGWPYAREGDSYYRLTLCCRAYPKGTDAGIVCRSCYADIDPETMFDPRPPLTVEGRP